MRRQSPPLIWLLLLFLSLPGCAPPDSAPSRAGSVDAPPGRVMQALYLVEAEAARDGWTAARSRRAGDLWLEAGDRARALAYYEAAWQREPGNPAMARALAQGYVDLQRWPQAVSALERLLALAPDDAWARLQWALIRAPFDARAAEAAFASLAAVPAYWELAERMLAALRRGPSDPLGLAVGLALADLELWPYAELALRHAAAADAPNAVALAYAALARDRQGKDGGPWMAQAEALAPQDAGVRFLDGLLRRSRGDYPASLEALAAALALDPENPALHAELGSAYLLVGNLAQAEYWLQSAVRVSGEDPRFQTLLALFYTDQAANLTEGGVQALAGLAERLPADAGVRAGLGRALVLAGRVDEGLAALDAALALEPDNPRALLYTGLALAESGDRDAGLALIRQVAAGDSPFAAEALAYLNQPAAPP